MLYTTGADYMTSLDKYNNSSHNSKYTKHNHNAKSYSKCKFIQSYKAAQINLPFLTKAVNMFRQWEVLRKRHLEALFFSHTSYVYKVMCMYTMRKKRLSPLNNNPDAISFKLQWSSQCQRYTIYQRFVTSLYYAHGS